MQRLAVADACYAGSNGEYWRGRSSSEIWRCWRVVRSAFPNVPVTAACLFDRLECTDKGNLPVISLLQSRCAAARKTVFDT